MTLRTAYSGALNVALAAARAAGETWVTTTNIAAITAAMSSASTSGKVTFTVTLPVGYQPADLRLLGPLWFAFQTGVQDALASQDIYNNEVDVELNAGDQVTTSIDLNFAF